MNIEQDLFSFAKAVSIRPDESGNTLDIDAAAQDVQAAITAASNFLPQAMTLSNRAPNP
jgi:hypothetical protein